MPEITDAEIVHRFGYHKAVMDQGGTGPRHQQARKEFIKLAKFIARATATSREQSLALTALQEAAMWTNAAIAMDAPLVDE